MSIDKMGVTAVRIQNRTEEIKLAYQLGAVASSCLIIFGSAIAAGCLHDANFLIPGGMILAATWYILYSKYQKEVMEVFDREIGILLAQAKSYFEAQGSAKFTEEAGHIQAFMSQLSDDKKAIVRYKLQEMASAEQLAFHAQDGTISKGMSYAQKSTVAAQKNITETTTKYNSIGQMLGISK